MEKRKRIKLLAGDIFEILLKCGKKKYFQFICIDDKFLGGNLVRLFSPSFDINSSMSIEEIAKLPVENYTYTIIKLVYNSFLCNKIGNISLENNFVLPKFKSTNTPYSTEIVTNWYINQVGQDYIKVGVLNSEQQKYPFQSLLMPELFQKFCEIGEENMGWAK